MDHRKLGTDLRRIREVADKATMELGQREHIINHLCATARNAFCRTQWRMGFAQGMRKGDGGERHVEWIDGAGRDCRAAGAAIAVCTLALTEVPSLGQHVRHNMLVSRAAAEATRSVRIELLLASGCRRRRLHPGADGGALPRPAQATQYERVTSRRRGDAVR